jgi:2-dehydropantoate 2-reductase
MRQVPRYCLIGKGRLGRHLSHYLHLLGVDHVVWSRQDPLSQLHDYVASIPIMMLCIPDDAIEPFIREHATDTKGPLWVHGSGALSTPLAYGIHPLMTFGETLYPLATYQQIPLVRDACHDGFDASEIAAVFSELPNPCFDLASDKKALYHAWCAMAGNGACLLWQRFQHYLAHELNMPAEAAHPYMQQLLKNVMAAPDQAMTGPWSRGDIGTVARHETALTGLAEAPVYQALQQWFTKGDV